MDDLISRQAVIDEVKKLFEMGECYCDRASIVGMLNSMPSVSTEKTVQMSGIQHFEDIANGKFEEQFTCVAITDGNEKRHICVVNCSRFCLNPRYACEKNKNICHNCGAKMVEPQESEDRK